MQHSAGSGWSTNVALSALPSVNKLHTSHEVDIICPITSHFPRFCNLHSWPVSLHAQIPREPHAIDHVIPRSHVPHIAPICLPHNQPSRQASTRCCGGYATQSKAEVIPCPSLPASRTTTTAPTAKPEPNVEKIATVIQQSPRTRLWLLMSLI
jgi:hypothetical protein